MSKVVIFSRVSTTKQTLEQQTEKLKEEADKRGYNTDNQIIIEQKESATKLSISERIGLQKLKDVIEKHQDIDCIIIYELSRLSRRPADLYQIRDYLLSKKINLISLTPYMELLDENGNFNNMASVIFGIYSSLSEQEGYLRVERVKRGIAKKKSEGNVMGRCMIFGYDRIDGKPVIKNNEAEIVKEIFSRFESGESCGSIGKDMYLRGVFGGTSKLNSYVCRVSNIIHEERYTGIFPFPAIISKKSYDRCREIILKRDNTFARINRTDKDYYCAGVLYTESGFKMSPSYGNNRYQYRNPDHVYDVSLNMKITDRLTLYALKKYLGSGIGLKEKQEERDEIERKIQLNREKKEEIEKKIIQIKVENERIEERIIKGRMNESRGDSMIDENLKFILKMEEMLDDITYSDSMYVNRMIYLDSFMYDIENEGIMLIDTVEDIRSAIRKYIDRIIVHREGFGKFMLEYLFKDKTIMKYRFTSIVHKVEFFDSDYKKIELD